jgi:rhodanese-related sulfurtransferase
VSADRTTVDELYAAACRRIGRLEPVAAHAACREGAILVDIRDADARRRSGIVPGSLHIPRTVLEWRVDPGSAWRTPHVSGLDARLILLCDHGYSSALAAAVLVDLGFERMADVIGGFAAWREAGLPVAAARRRAARALPGLAPPD